MSTDTRNIGEKKSILEQTTGSMLSSGLSTKKQADDNSIVKSSDGSEVITDPSKVKSKNIAEVAKESNKSSGEGSFIKLNEKQKDQIQASYDRSNMRQAGRLLKNTGEIGTIKSEYANEKNIGRLDLKNIKAQDRINKRLQSSRDRLDKKILKHTGDASLTYKNRSAKQAADQERFSNIAKNLNAPSGAGPYPLSSNLVQSAKNQVKQDAEAKKIQDKKEGGMGQSIRKDGADIGYIPGDVDMFNESIEGDADVSFSNKDLKSYEDQYLKSKIDKPTNRGNSQEAWKTNQKAKQAKKAGDQAMIPGKRFDPTKMDPTGPTAQKAISTLFPTESQRSANKLASKKLMEKKMNSGLGTLLSQISKSL